MYIHISKMVVSLIVVIVACCPLKNIFVSAQFYTAASGMRSLTALEKGISKVFLKYYYAEMQRVNELEAFLNQQELLANESKRIVSHPINAFKCIKRFTQQWYNFSQFHRPEFSSPTYDTYTELYKEVSGFGDYSELSGSITAIIKLQETYEIDVKKFTNGFNRHSQKLALYDIFLIGYYAMDYRYYQYAKLWLQEAYDRYQVGPDRDLHQYDYTRLLESLIWSYYNDNDLKNTVYYTKKLLGLKYSAKVARDLEYYQDELWRTMQNTGQDKNKTEDKLGPMDGEQRPWLKRLNQMCRGEEKIGQKIKNGLYCSNYRPTYQFFLKPMKMEILYFVPYILYFHNFLSASEADALIETARGSLDSAQVFHPTEKGKITTAGFRISKSTWLMTYDETAAKVESRLDRLMNINTRYAENLQIANYGIGGNYESHFDHASWPQDASVFGPYNWGNRVSTLLLYLSDVEKGGDTVFVNTGPGVVATPRKGAGVFWYNLKLNGEGDPKTQHAGCPVLLGEKWIANLWIHEWGQEFRRPCALDRKL